MTARAVNAAGSAEGAQASGGGVIQPENPSTDQRLWSEARLSIVYGAAVLLTSVAVFAFLVSRMPRLTDAEQHTLIHNFPPKSLGSVVAVRDIILNYAGTYPTTVAVTMLLLYVLMQTFALPGTGGLSLLIGALYGSARGFALVAVVSTLGSTSCYCLSWAIGRPIARAVWKGRLDDFKAQVVKRQHDLLNYIIFLRLTPLLPNIFINVASPIVGVPLLPFMLGTLIGCLPNNFMAAHAGDHLSDLASLSDLYNPRILLLGCVVGVGVLLPVFIKHRHERSEAAAAAAAAASAAAAPAGEAAGKAKDV